MNEERGTTGLEGGHIALFLLNIWYLVLPCPVAGWRFVGGRRPWDKGCPWMGSKCSGGFCKKTYQKCSSNSDCDASKSKCGPKGYCVGK